MSWSASYVVPATIRDALNNDIALSLKVANANKKIALYNDSVAPDSAVDPQSYNVAPWNTGEVNMGASPWPAGGIALDLTGTGLTVVTGGVMFTAVDIAVLATTLPNMFGCLIYDNSLSPKCAIVAVSFGAAYSTSAGALSIAWDATNGIFATDLTP